jgi:hypothetical protein
MRRVTTRSEINETRRRITSISGLVIELSGSNSPTASYADPPCIYRYHWGNLYAQGLILCIVLLNFEGKRFTLRSGCVPAEPANEMTTEASRNHLGSFVFELRHRAVCTG